MGVLLVCALALAGAGAGPSDGRVALRAARWLDLGLAPERSTADLGDAPLLPGDRIEIRIRP